MDGVEGTGRFAVAKTETAVGAGFAAAEQLSCRLTAHVSVVIHDVGGIGFCTFAQNHCRHGSGISRSNAHDLGNGFRAGGAAGGTQGGIFTFAGSQCRSVTGAAGITAGTAVGTGQDFFDGDRFLVDRDGHDDGGDGQNESEDQAKDGDDEDR